MESLADALRDTAARVPGKTFLRFAEEGDMTFAEFDSLVDALASGFHRYGVGQGDLVSLMLPNCLEFVACWLALARLGAITAAINVDLRGQGLAHVLEVARSRLLVVDEQYLDPLAVVARDLAALEVVLVRGDTVRARRLFAGVEVQPVEAVHGSGSVPRPEIVGGDLMMLIFTSGTTGVSKACSISHRYAIRQGEILAEHGRLGAEDVFYCPFPLFHGDASMYTVVPAILLGATASLGRRFSVSGFWDEIRAFDATTFDYMGATLALLMKQPKSPSDREHRARMAWGLPLPEWAPAFSERFGVELVTGYGMTETGVVAFQPADEPLPPGAVGKPVWPYELRIVDDLLCPLAPGEVGEIQVKPHEPHVIVEGYYGMPTATAETFGGEWVRTGDLGSLDAEGFLYFSGRKKDALRRRGRNISAFEIEQVLDTFPAVLESAVCGIESELTEQDVMAFVVPRPGESIDPVTLIEFCRERMAAYMIPRYVQILGRLPKTPTEKIAKNELVAMGVTASTWDREAQRA